MQTVEDDPSAAGHDTAAPDPKRWTVLAVLCLALLVVGIDGTIVNVALPTLVRDLEASFSELQWIVDAYTIVFAGFLLIAGNTGDRLGRKRCFLVGLVVFGIGSFGCSQAGSAIGLIGFRAVQGLGAAFIMPATLSILTNVFRDPAERARAIALWAGVSGLGVAVGPLAGGYLLEHFWWGSIFLVNVPLVLFTIVAVVVVVPSSRDPHAQRLDVLGTVLSTVGLVSMLFGIIEGPARGWGDVLVISSFVAGVVLLTSFVFWERITDHPILDISFFSDPRFSAASVAITLVFFAMFGSLFFVSQYLQFVLGYSPLRAGAALLPVAAALMVSAPLSATLVRWFGTKAIVTVGLLLVAASLLLFTRVTVSSGYPLVAAVLVIIGIGMGLAMAPATDSIMGSLPPEKAGVGSAMNDTTREIGGALGVAVMGSITSAVYASTIVADPGFAVLQQASPEAATAVKQSIGGASFVATQLPEAARAALVEASNAAFVHALDRTVVVAAVAALLGALVALLFLPARARDGEAVEELLEGAALRIPADPEQHRSLARVVLSLLAEAGMSSLTYNAVSAQSGIGAAGLARIWTSQVDAVTDAIAEIYGENPVPDTGDLRADLRAYIGGLAAVLAEPNSRRVLSTLLAEATSDRELRDALRERVLHPRRADLARRLERDAARVLVPIETAVDQLVGPIYHRALLLEIPVDDELLDAIVSSLLGAEPTAKV